LFQYWQLFDCGPRDQTCPLVCLPPVSGTADVYFLQCLALSAKGYRVIAVRTLCHCFLNLNVFCMPVLATSIFSLFNFWMKQDWVQELILAWLWQHFHLVINKIRIQDLSIVSWVHYPLDQNLAILCHCWQKVSNY